MAKALKVKLLAAARAAAEELSSDGGNPRIIEANMDILSTALLKLDVVKVRSRRRSSFDLCEILEEFVRRGLVDSSAVRCCRGIEELIQVSDYDISNFDAFEEEVLAEIEVLQEELEQTFAILEKRTAVED